MIAHRPSFRLWVFSIFGFSLIALVLRLAYRLPVSSVLVAFVVSLAVFSVVYITGGGRTDPHQGRAASDFAIAILVIWSAGVVWGQGYLSPTFEYQFAAGETHIDTLYLSSYANMVARYGVASTGVDGLVHVPYHFLSNAVLGLIGRVGGIGALAAYNILFPIVFVPLLLFLMMRLAGSDGANGSFVASWVLVFGIVGILPQKWRYELTTGWNSILISESYTLGIILLLVFVLFAWNRSIDSIKRPVALVVAMAMTFLIGLSKISIGVLVAISAVYWWMRWYRKDRGAVLWPLLTGIGAFAAYLVANDPTVSGGIRVFDFFRGYVSEPLLPWFFLQYWPIAALWGTNNHATVKERRATELLTLVAAIGLVPGNILDIGSGSAFYFSNVYYWPALALVARRIGTIWSNKDIDWRHYARNPLVVFIGAITLGGVLVNTALPVMTMAGETVSYRDNRSEDAWELYLILENLDDLQEIGTEHRRTAVWISPDAASYWNRTYRADAVAFIVPAISGYAAIAAIPEEYDTAPAQQFRGYGSYTKRGIRPPIDDLDEARAAARAEDFDHLFILTMTHGQPEVRIVNTDDTAG